MGCCLDFEQTVASLKDAVESVYPKDYKIFVMQRVKATATTFRVRFGVVVLPDTTKGNMLFKALMKLSDSLDCVSVLESRINHRDSTMVDLFIVDIEEKI